MRRELDLESKNMVSVLLGHLPTGGLGQITVVSRLLLFSREWGD